MDPADYFGCDAYKYDLQYISEEGRKYPNHFGCDAYKYDICLGMTNLKDDLFWKSEENYVDFF